MQRQPPQWRPPRRRLRLPDEEFQGLSAWQKLKKLVVRETREWVIWLDAGLAGGGGGLLRGFQRLGAWLRPARGEAVAQAPTLRQLLGRGGWTLFVLFLAHLITSLFPFRILHPDWYVRLGVELINTSPVMLTGFGLLASVGILNRRASGDQLPRRALVWSVLRLVWLLYLLVIPMQVVATLQMDQKAQGMIRNEWTARVQAISEARPLAKTEEQRKELKKQEFLLLVKRNQATRQIRLKLYSDMVRVVVSAMALVWALRLPLVVLDEQTDL